MLLPLLMQYHELVDSEVNSFVKDKDRMKAIDVVCVCGCVGGCVGVCGWVSTRQ